MKSEATNIFMNLLAAVKAVNYYPPKHPSRTQPVTRSHQLVKPMLVKRAKVVLAVVEDTLVFEGQPFFDDSNLHVELKDALDDRKIVAITIHRGVTEDELGVLVEILSMPPSNLSAWESVDDLLRSREVSHIEIEIEEEDIREKAKKVYSNAKGFILDIMKQDRMGALPKGEKAIELMSSMQDVILQDRDALMGLTLLSDYDNYTFNHSVNVGVFALALAHQMGMAGDDAVIGGLSGMLHDVGKTNIPLTIINKPGKLDDEEWRIMQTHPVESAKILQQMGSAIREEVVIGVLTHHVRFDHTGYPAWDKPLIPGAELAAVADCYDSMTTLRPYQKRFEPKDAVAVMQRLSGKGLHPAYVEAFIKMLGVYPVGSVVRLNTNEIAIVFGTRPEQQDTPLVKIIMDGIGNYLPEPEMVDLAGDDGKLRGIQRRIVTAVDPSIKNINVAKYL
jgi:HD-GYP domain-containing protein (c-di-GMP phosphodiesterase class II)